MRKYFSISALALLSILCFSITFTSCGDDEKEKEKELKSAIVGTWEATWLDDGCVFHMTLLPDGRWFQSEDCGSEKEEYGIDEIFTWTVENDILSITYEHDDWGVGVDKYQFEIKNDKLYLTYEDENDHDTLVYKRVK